MLMLFRCAHFPLSSPLLTRRDQENVREDPRQQHLGRLESFLFWAPECSANRSFYSIIVMLRNAPLMLGSLLDVPENTFRPSWKRSSPGRTRF